MYLKRARITVAIALVLVLLLGKGKLSVQAQRKTATTSSLWTKLIERSSLVSTQPSSFSLP